MDHFIGLRENTCTCTSSKIENGHCLLTYECDCGHIYTEKWRAGPTKCKVCNPPKRGVRVDDHPSYGTWSDMMGRCYSLKHHKYFRYGGRGITVCERWHKFANFLEDMGEKPPGLSIDRIDNDGNYEPGNCRWANPREQAQNRSNNVNITINGETLCISEWARRSGLSRDIINSRFQNGWALDRILDPPMGKS